MIGQMIDKLFYGFDMTILTIIHNIAVATNNAFEWPCLIISFFFNHGAIPVIAILVALMIYKPTRKAAFCVLLGMALGALMTNLYIKPVVMRLRPYDSGNATLYEWWQYVGAHVQLEYSFPSGHTTAMTAIVTVLITMLSSKKKYFLLVCIPLMGFVRNYLMVHYPSDIVGGIIIGIIGGYLGYRLGTYIFKRAEMRRNN